jgi:NADH-quinone oxidoreductase subunit G
MTKLVTLTIDDKQVTVAAGMLIVDAAKKIGNDIPVFCYHPKMEPVGMCRMCLVEVGRPMIDRGTGQVVLDENNQPKLQIGPKLETACTTPVSEGMVVRTNNPVVEAARKEMLEFLLTSHPLDCPVCDKGGECPLQNLTMGFGPGESRFLFDDKIRLAKNVPLGELIYLDRERCIQCARCVRFQDIIADDPVIGFYNRGRRLEIVSYSEPGFDSIFSGNTTDICPVGALTTADFRFGARPWELKPAASICTHCPVGCNLTLNVRREARAGGGWVIKRVMPRQNEEVNEIWICDKGRFAYQFTESQERLTQPLMRKGDDLVPVSWDEALDLAAAKIKDAKNLVTLAGGRLSNEDLFNLYSLTKAKNGQALYDTHMAGGDLVAQYGLAQDSNFSNMGSETTILVIASDLHQEAPVWWLRVKQAAERGANLIVLNPRTTRLDKFARHSLRYTYGEEAAALSAFMPEATVREEYLAAVETLKQAENLVVIYGSEGLGLSGSQALSQNAAALLASRARVGQPNNGLLAVWSHANSQGVWDTGFRPSSVLADVLSSADVLLLAAADPAGDDPALAEALDAAGFVIVQELFLTESARRSDLVFRFRP